MTGKNEIIELQAVIVLYNCQPQQSPALSSFYQATRRFSGRVSLLIYDNSPVPATSLPALPGLNIIYQHDEHNSGLSKAYNTAAKLAAQSNLSWLLLLDQDTNVTPDYISIFVDEQIKNPWCKLFAPVLMDNQYLVSPFRWHYGRGSKFKHIPEPGSYYMKNMSLANSGLLINLHYYNLLGGYNNEIKLDFADIDFCSKVASSGEEFILLNSTLEHSLNGLKSNDAVVVMIRLTRYCHSANTFARTHKLFMIIGIRLFIKSLQLTLKFRKIRFLKIFVREFLQLKHHAAK